MRTIFTIVILLFTAFAYGQKSTLIQNINDRATELKHNLNHSRDSLILEGQRLIDRVTIFNDDFEKTFEVKHNKANIPLHNIPVGRFITEVKLNDKLIIITLLRHETLKTTSNVSVSRKVVDVNNKSFLASHIESKGKIESLPETTKKPIKVARFYWIVNKIYKGHSSRKIMKIGDKKAVAKMIQQNEIDLKTKSGKYNELTIWEVYDTTKFMRYTRQNPDYANSESVDFFNTVPFFHTALKENRS